MSGSYPNTVLQRDRWILQHRGPKNLLEPSRPYAFLWEEEYDANRELDRIAVAGRVRYGERERPESWSADSLIEAQVAHAPRTAASTRSTPLKSDLISTATIFLTNRECPFRCLMCDLWQNTLDERVPAGAIAGQIRYALAQLPPARQIKLYNAGSFFDPQAIPPEGDPEIAQTLSAFARVIVECHPAFLRGKYARRVLRFRDLIRGRLEVAIGLETVHEPTLQKLNKRMTLADFQRAAEFLKSNDMDLRVFLLLRPPFLNEAEGIEWACRSLDFAAGCQADVCTVIPTRGGNGAMEALGEQYQPPQLSSLETVVEYGIGLHAFRVFADLWDVEKFSTCECSSQRAQRLAEMNRTQQIPPAIVCRACNI